VPQNLLNRLSLGELVDKLVEIADLALQRLPDILNPIAANRTGDERPRRVQGRRVREECLEVGIPLDLRFQARLRITGKPADDLVDLLPRPPFRLRLADILRYTLAKAIL
jgi:hypothetical protein